MSLCGVGQFVLKLSAGRRGARLVQRLIGDVGFPVPLVRSRTTHGLTLLLDPTSIMDVEVIRNGYYELDTLEAIQTHLPEEGVFWDVGSNIGLHAATISLLKPSVKVVAFEPAPATFARLMQTIALNNCDIQTVPVALGDVAGYSPMSIKLRGNTGISSLSPWPGSSYDATTIVRVERGDNLIDAGQCPLPNVIKIDVEGHEKAVLIGLGDSIENDVIRTIIFESSLEALPEIKTFCAAKGFTVLQINQKNYVATRVAFL